MFRTKATAYAILAAAEIAQHTNGSPSAGLMAADIASTYDLPKAYAAKIMSQLAKAHVLMSDRGPRGGFRLARPAEQITLLEIFEAVQGQVGAGDAASVPEPLRGVVEHAYRDAVTPVHDHLAATSLADLLHKP